MAVEPFDDADSKEAVTSDQVLQPFNGFKAGVLYVTLSPYGQVTDYHFAAITWPGRYKVGERAICTVNPSHVPPVDTCTCGFYALTSFSDIWFNRFPGASLVQTQILDVAFSGDVIEGTRGFRAGTQHIQKVTFRPTCEHRGCSAAAQTIVADRSAVKHTGSLHSLGTGVAPQWFPLVVRCTEHAASDTRIPISDVAALLGVDVQLASSAPVASLSPPSSVHRLPTTTFLVKLAGFAVGSFAAVLLPQVLLAYRYNPENMGGLLSSVALAVVLLLTLTTLIVMTRLNVGGVAPLTFIAAVTLAIVITFSSFAAGFGLYADTADIISTVKRVDTGVVSPTDMSDLIVLFDFSAGAWSVDPAVNTAAFLGYALPPVSIEPASSGAISWAVEDNIGHFAALGSFGDKDTCLHVEAVASNLVDGSTGSPIRWGWSDPVAGTCTAQPDPATIGWSATPTYVSVNP